MKKLSLIFATLTLFSHAIDKDSSRSVNPYLDQYVSDLLHTEDAPATERAMTSPKKEVETAIPTHIPTVNEARLIKEREIVKQQIITSKGTVAQKKSHKQSIEFIKDDQMFQILGTSEIHGNLKYPHAKKAELEIKDSKIYLIPQNKKSKSWYQKYYQNKTKATAKSIPLEYTQVTQLDPDNAFAFYGIVAGSYYVIIATPYHFDLLGKEKHYIAKNIKIAKKEKVLANFSR